MPFRQLLEAVKLDDLKPLELVMAVTALARKKLHSMDLAQSLQRRLEDSLDLSFGSEMT